MSGLPEFMDDLLNPGLGDVPPYKPGGPCETFAGGFSDPRHGAQLIATYFWWSLWHSSGDVRHGRVIVEVLRRAFGHDLGGAAQAVVVADAEVSRFNLLLIDPFYGGAPAGVVLRPDRRERFVQIRGKVVEPVPARGGSSTDEPTPPRRVYVAPRLVQQAVRYELGRATAIQDTGAARSWKLSTAMVLAALDEICHGTEFGIVLAGCRWPAREEGPDGSPRRPRHAADDGREYPPMLESIPVLHNPQPMTAEKAAAATYLGRTSGVTRNFVRGYSPDVVHPRPLTTTTGIFTSPGMAPGDEDSSLVDRDGSTIAVGARQVHVQVNEPAGSQGRKPERQALPVDAWNWIVQVLANRERT